MRNRHILHVKEERLLQDAICIVHHSFSHCPYFKMREIVNIKSSLYKLFMRLFSDDSLSVIFEEFEKE